MSYFTAKCTKFDFGCGSAADPAWGAYSAPLLDLRGLGVLLREGEGQVWERRGGMEPERGWEER